MRDKSKGRVVRLVKYVSIDKGNPARIGEVIISNCSSPDAFIASKEMEATQHLNTRSGDDKTYHLSISFPNGERPDAGTISHIDRRIAGALGYGDHQRISIVHDDTDNMHLHMVINKIHPGKNTILTVKNDHNILANECARLERELSLKADNHQAKRGPQESKIDNLEHKRGTESFAAYAREQATAALTTAKTWGEFQDALAASGIEAKLRGNGMVFVDASGEIAAKGSSLGRGFTKGNLEKLFGPFEANGCREPENDREKIQQLNFSKSYKETPKYGDKSLYDEYRAEREKIERERAALLALLKKERTEALEKAGREAVKSVDSQSFLNALRTRKLVGMLKKQARRRMTRPVLAEFKERRNEILKRNRKMGYVDWLKAQARAGNVRAIFTLRGKGEVAPEVISISSRDLADAKAIAAKIEGVTGRGTLFYAAGKDVFRDDGKNLSLRSGVSDEGIRKALIIARSKFNNAPLTLEGTEEFMLRCAEIAKRGKLDITFANPRLDSIRRAASAAARSAAARNDEKQGFAR
jgi:hypothetical protein